LRISTLATRKKVEVSALATDRVEVSHPCDEKMSQGWGTGDSVRMRHGGGCGKTSGKLLSPLLPLLFLLFSRRWERRRKPSIW
jgi:hypothetical protein